MGNHDFAGIFQQNSTKSHNSMRKIYHLSRHLPAAALLLVAPAAVGQVITGKVTADDSKAPMPGVTVVLKGSTTGTASGADGTYSINVPNRQGTLIFSFIGYATQEVPIN